MKRSSIALALAALAIACGDASNSPSRPAPAPPQSAPASGAATPAPAPTPTAVPAAAARVDAPAANGFVEFVDVTERAGIAFVHRNGKSSARMMPESVSGGVAVIDYDRDGRQDLYFVDGGDLQRNVAAQQPGGNRLYRNLGDWRFEDVTAKAGVAGRGYMFGAVVGDYDANGFPDLYVTAVGSNTLYRNRGDGTFEDVTVASGADDQRWSTGAAFLDYDKDGDEDLFVQNYVDWDMARHRVATVAGVPVYPTPDMLDPVASRLLRNRGDGTFEDVSGPSGIGAIASKGLGVLTLDFDFDGDVELYCACDTMPNLLFTLREGGRFEEIGALSGAAYGQDGREEAGMGVDGGDLDGDGEFEIVVTNFAGEPNAIYRGEGALAFTEFSNRTGTRASSTPALGFGVRIVDFDNDGQLDFVVNNGSVYDNAEQLPGSPKSKQSPLLYRNLGRARFSEVAATQPAEFRRPKFGRGLATADFDDDGDQDLVLCDLGAKPQLFENRGGAARAWLRVQVQNTHGSAALGALVTVEHDGRRWVDQVRSASSYLSQSDLRLHFGLGELERVERVRVRWLDGSQAQATDVPTRGALVFRQGVGQVK